MSRSHGGLSLIDLSRATGIHRVQIYRYRKGLIEPSVSSLARIADVCEVTLWRLIYWAEGGN